MNSIADLLIQLNQWVWGYPLLLLLVGVGIYYTILLRGLQFRYLFYSVKLIFANHDHEAEGDVSQFQALMTAMSATIGIGSITGVATAITAGGLGAIFWMWVVGFLGMATKYAEAILGIKYRIQDASGSMKGGPMYYLEQGLNWKKLGAFFAVSGALAALTTGNMVQSNSVADALVGYLPISRLTVGIVLAIFTAVVLLRGIQSIAWVTQVMVPVMGILYICGAAAVVAVHYSTIPASFALIFKSAFQPQAAIGGFLGSTVLLSIRMGITRGIFSNEAGLGSSPIASAAAKTDQPGRQAMISMSGAFLATFIVCTLTGLVIATTHVLGLTTSQGVLLNGSKLVMEGFNQTFPGSAWLVSLALILFGYTTILGWAYYGEKCVEYLLGARSIVYYRFIYIAMVLIGATLGLELIWSLSDLSNACMVFPNLLGLIGLSWVVKKESDTFLNVVKQEKLKLQVR